MITFQKGDAYFATPTAKSAKQKIVACIGRRGRFATFARVDMLHRVQVGEIEGRETAIIKAKDGLDYFISAATVVDVANAANVLAALEG